MQSSYKKIIVYDLETGGLVNKWNSITEIAMVVIDLDSLVIVDEISIMMLPYLDLSNRQTEPIKEARDLFKYLKTKDEETFVNVLKYKDENITLKNIDPLAIDIQLFYDYLSLKNLNIIHYKDFLQLENSKEFKHIVRLFFNKCYNPHALEATHISRKMLHDEGIPFVDCFKKVHTFITSHNVGNSKPIIAGHNIGTLPRRIVKGKEKAPDGFDNPFMEKFFMINGEDFFDVVNEKMIDTLKEAKLKWFELPSYSLGACANEVGLTLSEAHRALPDTRINAQFLIKMLKNLRGEGSQQSKYVRKKYKFQF